jgi:hypothetical protein
VLRSLALLWRACWVVEEAPKYELADYNHYYQAREIDPGIAIVLDSSQIKAHSFKLGSSRRCGGLAG